MTNEFSGKAKKPDVESSDYYDAFARECCYTESYRQTPWGEYFHLKRRIGSIEAAISGIAGAHRLDSAADIGCGDGALLPALCRAANRVIGYDISPERLKLAGNLLNEYPGLSLKVLDVMKDSPGEEYDMVTCSEVIEHVSNPSEFFSRLAGMVKPGGHLALSTPSRWGVREKSLRAQQAMLNLVQNRLRGRNESRWRFFHIGLLTVSQLEQLAGKYFSEHSLKTVGLYMPVLTEIGFIIGGDKWRGWYEKMDDHVGKSAIRWINWTQILVAKKSL